MAKKQIAGLPAGTYDVGKEKWTTTAETENCFRRLTGFELKYPNRFTNAFQQNIRCAQMNIVGKYQPIMTHELFIAKFDFVNHILEITPNVSKEI